MAWKLIKTGDKPKSTEFDYVKLDGKDVFCELSSAKPRPYVPRPLRDQIIMSLHNLDHVGIKASQTRIASEYYWPSLKEDIKKHVKCCNTCNKIKPGKKLVNLGEFAVPDKRFSHVLVDLVGRYVF